MSLHLTKLSNANSRHFDQNIKYLWESCAAIHATNMGWFNCLLFGRGQGGGGEVFYCGEIHSVTHSPYRHRQHCWFAKKKGKRKRKHFADYPINTPPSGDPTWQVQLWQGYLPDCDKHTFDKWSLPKKYNSHWGIYLRSPPAKGHYLTGPPDKHILTDCPYQTNTSGRPDSTPLTGSPYLTSALGWGPYLWQVHLWQRSLPGRYTSDRDPYLAGTPVTEIPTWQVHQWQRSLHDRYTCDRFLLDRYTCDRIPTWQVHQWQRSKSDKYTCGRHPYLTSTPVTEIPTWQIHLWQGGVPTWQVHLWQRSLPDKYTSGKDPYLTSVSLTGRGSYMTEIPTWQVHLWQRSLPDKYTSDRGPVGRWSSVHPRSSGSSNHIPHTPGSTGPAPHGESDTGWLDTGHAGQCTQSDLDKQGWIGTF